MSSDKKIVEVEVNENVEQSESTKREQDTSTPQNESNPRKSRRAKPNFKISPAKANVLRELPWRYAQVALGSLLVAISMNYFVMPNGLLSGGFSGLSLLIKRIVEDQTGIVLSYALLNLSLNLIPAIYAFFNIGKNFFSLSLFSIVFTSIVIDLLPNFSMTNDIVLAAIFAGVLNGIGLSIILNADACAGGTDFIAIAISNKKHLSLWNYFLGFNVLLLIISAIYFDIDRALYSIIYQFISTQIINLGHLRYQRRTCFVITSKPEPLAQELMKITRHGITVFKGMGAYSGQDQYLLYMVVGKTDIRKIKHYLKVQAPGTFLNITDSEQLGGNFFVEPMN